MIMHELTVLYEISRILDRTEDIKQIITPILEALTEYTPVLRGAITLLNRDTGEILIESALGLTENQKKKGRYRVGEGITGQVVKTGVPVIIPDISKDTRLVNKTGAERSDIDQNKNAAFVCVPIKSGNATIGTMNITCKNSDGFNLEAFVKLL